MATGHEQESTDVPVAVALPRAARASFASTPAIRARMQRQPRSDTALELSLRKALHAKGMRYRLQRQVIPKRTSDIVFVSARVVVDARSCFWHACAEHGTTPRSNREWWTAKFARTAARDAQTEAQLREAGWTVVVVWEHDDIDEVAERIRALVRDRTAREQPSD